MKHWNINRISGAAIPKFKDAMMRFVPIHEHPVAMDSQKYSTKLQDPIIAVRYSSEV